MLRLTQWMADYYLCSWAAALEAVLPAGVRSQAGTRRVTLLSLAADAKEKIAQATLSKKQFEIVHFLTTNSKPIEPGQLARAARCTPGPITALRRKGILKATTERISSESRARAERRAALPFS